MTPETNDSPDQASGALEASGEIPDFQPDPETRFRRISFASLAGRAAIVRGYRPEMVRSSSDRQRDAGRLGLVAEARRQMRESPIPPPIETDL